MVEVPDFYGLNRQQASDRAGELGLYILVTGNDSLSPQVVVTGQSPASRNPGAGGYYHRNCNLRTPRCLIRFDISAYIRRFTYEAQRTFGKTWQVVQATADMDMEIAHVAYDSRKVGAGDLFVAVTGFASDGNRFIPMAMEKGAACVVSAQSLPEGVPGGAGGV